MIDTTTVLAAFVDTLVELRPKALKHIRLGKGVYAHIVAGFRAQVELNRKRALAEAAAHRLPFAEGEELRELTASEYGTVLPTSGTKAIGSVSLTRGGGMPQGIIKKGHRFAKAGDLSASPAVQAAQYEAVASVFVESGASTATVNVECTTAGAHGNIPKTLVDSTLIESTDDLFDAEFETLSCEAAGGSAGPIDAILRKAATAYATGRFGPTAGAIIAGALHNVGVRYYAYSDYGSGNGIGRLYVADESWGCSDRWASAVQQKIANEFLGFGLRLDVGRVNNTFVSVQATVRLKQSLLLQDTSAIEERITKAIRAYFDREDWYQYDSETLKMAIVNADRSRILSCSSVTVIGEGGIVYTTSDADFTGVALTHRYLADNATRITFLPPN